MLASSVCAHACATRASTPCSSAGKGHWWTGRGYVRYLSDFHLWGHDALIVFPVEGEPALIVSSYAVANMIASNGWITDSAGDVFLVPRTLSALRQRGLERARLGTVGTPFIISADLHRQLVEQLPGADIRQADQVLDRVRVAKSDVEIAQNREVWELAKKAMERFAEVLRPGASQLRACRGGDQGCCGRRCARRPRSDGRVAPEVRTAARRASALRRHSFATTWRSAARAATGAS